MEKRNVKITIEQAKEWLENDQLKEIALEAFPELKEKSLPKTWEELGTVSGFYTIENSYIRQAVNIKCTPSYINFFATKEQAEASIALAQLSQLKKVYNGDWEADWSECEKAKYVIYFCGNDIVKDKSWGTSIFLSFKSIEIRDLFLENFRELIEKAMPLMS
jgi:hypothetical protein